MKKALYTIVAALAPMLLTAQEVQDSVTTLAGSQDAFYSMDNGSVADRLAADWDIAFEITGFTSSIRVNGGSGVELYRTPFSAADFAKFDTAGMGSWERLLNSNETWSDGAFNTSPANDFDLGWGVYNPNTHIVKGDSIYLMKLANQSYKKIYIDRLASNKYYFKHADLDGSNEKTSELNKSLFGGKVFGYFSITSDKVVDSEPAKKDWDILFTKYIDLVYQGPTPTPYPVSGVLINKGTEVAQREGLAVTDNDTSSLTWTTNISTIGSDWKQYNFPMNTYNITPDQAFFLRLQNGAVWKIYFTGYNGGSQGQYLFTKELIKASASQNDLTLNNAVQVFPNPSISGEFTLKLNKKTTGLTYSVSNISGQIVKNGTISDLTSIDLSNQESGLYFLTVAGSNSRLSKVLIKK
jgi:hypothetical protein